MVWFGLILVCDSPTISIVGFFILTLVYSEILFTFVLPQVADKQTKEMKATVVVKKEVEIKYLVVKVEGIDQSECVGLSPIDNDGNWCPIIDVSNGKILNWEGVTSVSIHEKVRDDGSYTLKDEHGFHINESENDYVPSCMCPQDNGYGDYIIMDISADGFIQGWKFGQSDVDEIIGVEED